MQLWDKHPRRQGDRGEAAAIHGLTEAGARVSMPLFHSPDYDLLAELDSRLYRVEVKTSTRHQDGRYSVQLATSGGNRSWSGLVKRFDRSRYDLLFVLVSDGRRWLIPTSEIEATTAITLGGPKYAEFELGDASPDGSDDGPLRIPARRGSAGAGEPGQTVNLVPQAEWVRIPPPPLQPPHEPQVVARTRLSANHQLTIPKAAFDASGFEVGDGLRVEVERPGRVVVTLARDHGAIS